MDGHTHAGPGEATVGLGRGLAVDLEPHVAAAIPGRGRLSAGDLGQVELQGTLVEDVGRRLEADGTAGGDGLRAGCARVGAGVASHLVRGDVRHAGIALEVVRLADRGPVGGPLDGGEEVCVVKVRTEV